MFTFTHLIDAEYFGEFNALITYDYTAGDKEILFPNDDAQPATGAEIGITSVIITLDDKPVEMLHHIPTHYMDLLEEAANEQHGEEE
jgi:hypothetical protein